MKLQPLDCCYQLILTRHVSAWMPFFTINLVRCSHLQAMFTRIFWGCSRFSYAQRLQRTCVRMPILVGKLSYIAALPVVTAVSHSPHEGMLQHTMLYLLCAALLPFWPKHSCACNTATCMVTTCIGGHIAPNLTAALGTQVQRHGVALLPHMIVQLLQYTTRLT